MCRDGHISVCWEHAPAAASADLRRWLSNIVATNAQRARPFTLEFKCNDAGNNACLERLRTVLLGLADACVCFESCRLNVAGQYTTKPRDAARAAAERALWPALAAALHISTGVTLTSFGIALPIDAPPCATVSRIDFTYARTDNPVAAALSLAHAFPRAHTVACGYTVDIQYAEPLAEPPPGYSDAALRMWAVVVYSGHYSDKLRAALDACPRLARFDCTGHHSLARCWHGGLVAAGPRVCAGVTHACGRLLCAPARSPIPVRAVWEAVAATGAVAADLVAPPDVATVCTTATVLRIAAALVKRKQRAIFIDCVRPFVPLARALEFTAAAHAADALRAALCAPQCARGAQDNADDAVTLEAADCSLCRVAAAAAAAFDLMRGAQAPVPFHAAQTAAHLRILDALAHTRTRAWSDSQTSPAPRPPRSQQSPCVCCSPTCATRSPSTPRRRRPPRQRTRTGTRSNTRARRRR